MYRIETAGINQTAILIEPLRLIVAAEDADLVEVYSAIRALAPELSPTGVTALIDQIEEPTIVVEVPLDSAT